MATPLMEQYQEIKKQNPGVILFFRLGDFYEMFDEEAKRVSALLGLTLTSRNGQPMCGVPYHSANQYISKLLKQGLKVAICEQTSTIPDPKTKLCPRKIVRIITPGTILEEAMLEANNSSYLVSILLNKDSWALACLEASTGDFWITQKEQDPDLLLLAQALGNINPSEIVCIKEDYAKIKTKIILPESLSISFVSLNQDYQVPPSWSSALEKYPLALKSAQHCLDYIVKTNTNFKEYFTPYYKELTDYMQLDSTALETLELTSSALGGRKNTLWGILDNTKTPMGSRLLKEWITRPLLNKEEIIQRQNIVSAFLQNEEAQKDLNLILQEVSDIKRILARIASATATPRDLAGLRKSLLLIKPIENWLLKHKEILPELYTLFIKNKNKLEEISAFLFKALNEEQPLKLADGGIIKQGFNKELDELNELKNNASSALEKICQTEREKTNIPNLKVGYNSVFGYYIEISKSYIPKVPYHYVRKQTLTNAERFITEELKELEKKILSAQDKSLRIEIALFEEIKKLEHKEKIYLLLNALIHEDEIEEAKKEVLRLEALGVNFIIQDLGLFTYLIEEIEPSRVIYQGYTLVCNKEDFALYHFNKDTSVALADNLSLEEKKILLNYGKGFITIFGRNPIYQSYRKILSLNSKNLSKEFKGEDLSLKEFTREDKFPVIENKYGTVVLNSDIIDYTAEVKYLSEAEYWFIDSLKIDHHLFLEAIKKVGEKYE